MEQLCRAINMPQEVTQQLVQLHNMMAWYPCLQLLIERDTWQAGLEQLKEALGDDPQGMKGLCCMLRCALMARDTYTKLGISEEIYVDTMAAFPALSEIIWKAMASMGFTGKIGRPDRFPAKCSASVSWNMS